MNLFIRVGLMGLIGCTLAGKADAANGRRMVTGVVGVFNSNQTKQRGGAARGSPTLGASGRVMRQHAPRTGGIGTGLSGMGVGTGMSGMGIGTGMSGMGVGMGRSGTGIGGTPIIPRGTTGARGPAQRPGIGMGISGKGIGMGQSGAGVGMGRSGTGIGGTSRRSPMRSQRKGH